MKNFTRVVLAAVIAVALLLPLLLIADGPATVNLSHARPLPFDPGDTFLGLPDTPVTYTGLSGEFLVVNSGETALTYSGTIYEDISNNRIGIGTATPLVALDVTGGSWNIIRSIGTDAGILQLGDTGGTSGKRNWAIRAEDDVLDIGSISDDWTAYVTQHALTIAPAGDVTIAADLDVGDDLDVNDQVLQNRVADGNDVSKALIAGDNEDGGYMFWADDYDNGTVIFGTSDTPGPVHALWVRYLVKNIEGTQVLWEGETVLEPGDSVRLWGQETPRIIYDLELSNDAHPRLRTYQIGSYHFRTTLLMIWISD